jgi:hypothetical protein
MEYSANKIPDTAQYREFCLRFFLIDNIAYPVDRDKQRDRIRCPQGDLGLVNDPHNDNEQGNDENIQDKRSPPCFVSD